MSEFDACHPFVYVVSEVGDKVAYISHGRSCIRLQTEADGNLHVSKPPAFQGQHEEADTILAFHARQIDGIGRIIVRASDTKVLVILVPFVGRHPDRAIVMDSGASNNRRLIDISQLARQLDAKIEGLSDCLIGLHILTGCDFTSSFYREGKSKPFDKLLQLRRDAVRAIQSLNTQDVSYEGVEKNTFARCPRRNIHQ